MREVSAAKVQGRHNDGRLFTKKRVLMRSTPGFSLVECLIANALALAMVGALAVTSANAISALQRVAARSDQSLQLGQIHQFLDAALTHARMPKAWVGDDTGSKAETAWRVPGDPCQPPDAAGPLHGWGGVTIIELSEVPCLPGSTNGKALYLEMIHPCLTACDKSAGYRLRPTQCHVSDDDVAVPSGPWRVDWQDSVAGIANCTEGAVWGWLERWILIRRNVAGAAGSPELRLHALSQGPIYRWTQAEVLVSGVGEWDLQFVDAPIKTTVDLTRLVYGVSMESLQTPWSSVIQLIVSVEPSISRVDLPSMRSVRLLIPAY